MTSKINLLLLHFDAYVSKGTSAKRLLKYMVDHQSTEMPKAVAMEQGLIALSVEESSDGFLDSLCQQAISNLPAESDAVKRGNDRVLNKLVGFVMKQSKGRVDAQTVHGHLKTMLLKKSS
jgi:aspartyl-tRNA(Asn)/glutamyl-tRNA(Gln) amidotransferase subunit B